MAMSEPIEHTLAAPIQAHGAEVDVLTLRRPTGKDVRELGFPYKLGGDESVVLSTEVIAKYISRLAAIPMSSVDQLEPSDMNDLGWVIAGFFLNSGRATRPTS
jgi:hypothetical protein